MDVTRWNESWLGLNWAKNCRGTFGFLIARILTELQTESIERKEEVVFCSLLRLSKFWKVRSLWILVSGIVIPNSALLLCWMAVLDHLVLLLLESLYLWVGTTSKVFYFTSRSAEDMTSRFVTTLGGLSSDRKRNTFADEKGPGDLCVGVLEKTTLTTDLLWSFWSHECAQLILGIETIPWKSTLEQWIIDLLLSCSVTTSHV